MYLLLSGVIVTGVVIGFAAGLLPATSAVFSVTEPVTAGSIVGVIFQRYSLIVFILLGYVGLISGYLCFRQIIPATLFATVMACTAIHCGWEFNRHQTIAVKAQIAEAGGREVAKPELIRRFRISHGISMVGLLVFLLGLLFMAGYMAVQIKGIHHG